MPMPRFLAMRKRGIEEEANDICEFLFFWIIHCFWYISFYVYYDCTQCFSGIVYTTNSYIHHCSLPLYTFRLAKFTPICLYHVVTVKFGKICIDNRESEYSPHFCSCEWFFFSIKTRNDRPYTMLCELNSLIWKMFVRFDVIN